MKVTLEFRLPEEENDFSLSLNAKKFKVAFEAVERWVAHKIQSEGETMSLDTFTAYKAMSNCIESTRKTI